MAAVSVNTAPVLGSTLSTRSSWPETGTAGQGSAPIILRRQFYDAAFAVHAHYLTVGRHQLLCPCGSSLGTGCAQRMQRALSALVRCAAVWACAALDAVLAALAAARCAAVEAVLALSSTRATNCSYCEGGSSSASSVGGQDGVGVVAAGPGIGGVAAGIDGCQHPLPAGASGQAAVHGDAVLRVQ